MDGALRRLSIRASWKRGFSRADGISLKSADGSLRSGVGETSQQAIACALQLALGCVSEQSNAVTFENIALTQYPWFFLAKVKANFYRIQQGEVLPMPNDAYAPPTGYRRSACHES